MTADRRGLALVTGAGTRIGRALALDLAAHGWAVAVHHRRSGDAAAEVVDRIVAGGGHAVALAADLAVEDEAAGLVDAAAAAAAGAVTCLVNNAAAFEYDSVETATRRSWDLHLDTNLRAPFVLSQAFARALPEGLSGTIVNMIDQRVWNLSPHFVSYTLSKAGLWTLTRTLALALAPRIRVNAIGPGPVLASARQSAESFAAQVARTPLRRQVGLDEICAALRFVVDAPSLTGQMIALDGGQHLGWQHPGEPGAPEPE